MNVLDKERLETLAGARGKNAIRKAALRIEDLGGLLELPESLNSADAAGSTPTKAEFDALRADLATMHLRLMAVVEAVQARIL